mgnify:CR=1 FL=1|jgi:hypothetical protein|tara:strand:- start:135878 stop:136081 length:204 start_codon:yes stop_codon:yes gene_type:complete
MMNDALADREVIIEMHPYGNVVKVSAFDVVSLTEVSIQAPKGTLQDIMKRNVLKRLEYVMRKKGLIN